VQRIYLLSTTRTTPITMKRSETEQQHAEEMKGDNYIKNSRKESERKKEHEEKVEREMQLCQFISEEFLIGKILVLNNIFYPVLAVIIILPDCFYYAFVQPSTVTSSFSYLACSIYSFNVCIPASIEVVTATTSFIPPFGYSFLCAANIITYYISLFFLSFFFSAIGIPLFKLFLKYSYEGITLEFDTAEGIAIKKRTTLQKLVLLLVPNRFRHYRPQRKNNQILDFGFCGRNYSFNLQGVPLSNWKKFVCQINGDLTILFSFGVLFPPLMIFGGICLIAIISFEFLTIGKLLHETRQLNYLWYETELFNESQRLMNVFRSNMYWTMFISCLLLGLIVFDTWGVEKGWRYGLIGFIILNIIPLCTFYLYYWFRKKSKERKRNRSTTTEGIEVSVLKEIRAGKSQEEAVTHVDNPICHNI
jgi:hypothetical protein